MSVVVARGAQLRPGVVGGEGYGGTYGNAVKGAWTLLANYPVISPSSFRFLVQLETSQTSHHSLLHTNHVIHNTERFSIRDYYGEGCALVAACT